MKAGRFARGGPLVVGACLALVLALRLIASGGESAGGPGPVRLPLPTPTADEECRFFARYWTVESGAAVGPEDVAAITDCRQDASGAWFLATGPDDPRLADGPVLTEDERAATAELRAEIVAQLDGLVTAMPADLRRALVDLEDPVDRPGAGQLREGGRPTAARQRYELFLRRYLAHPDRGALAGYVAWLTARRAEAFAPFWRACLGEQPVAVGCHNMEQALGIRGFPWLWDLRDPLALDAYLASTLEGDA